MNIFLPEITYASLLIIFIEALRAVEVTPASTTSVLVTMTPVEGNSDVSYYEAAYQRNYCTVRSSVSPLSCIIGNLASGTSYRISGMACMADGECSYKRFGNGYTSPDRKAFIRPID